MDGRQQLLRLRLHVNTAKCVSLCVCVCVTVCEEERGTEQEEEGREGGLRSLPGPLLTLIEADHRLIMSALFVEILPHQMTNLLHVYLYQIRGREAEEMREGKGFACVCVCVRKCLSLSLCRRCRQGANYLLLREQRCRLRPFILPPHTPPPSSAWPSETSVSEYATSASKPVHPRPAQR